MRDQSSRYFRYFTYIKPLTRTPIVRTYGTTIFTLIIMIIFILFAIKPTIETILVLQKKLADADVLLKKITQKTNDLTLGKKNLENMDPQMMNKVHNAITDSLELKSIIQSLEASAQRYEASVSALQIQPLNIEPKNEGLVGTLSEISFTFNVEGTYKNLVDLLQDLKLSSRLISVDTIAFNKVSEEGGLVMSISGKAYYLK